ncbi:glycoside hydrolase family 3 protein [Tortispora caseinolytica NRRL Y-17796]|uniref:Glycoside hydrolase family 3 protein n=1 Tax=Tortispora caseinolytica NRRL Y-17796 TaxID=767744 RepID=A0A1E4TAT3_9ASCO|nr:glycoside hydrolase family 3 protein [Tortispora caseinolytica NRRL Y-17796]
MGPEPLPDVDIGQMFMVGFDGPEIDDNVRVLIEKYKIGNILLSAKNLIDAKQASKLTAKLQEIAFHSGHRQPLTIAIDQENGMLNNLYDSEYITQFPGAMAIAAAASTDYAYSVAKATAQEMKACGINWILGPVLDVFTTSSNRLLGIRTMGDDPNEVADLGIAQIRGFQEGGVMACGKHFPGYGNAIIDNLLSLPVVNDTVEQLEMAPLVPFQKAGLAGLDSVIVGGCAVPKVAYNDMHACLSPRVIKGMLRERLGFQGVVLSECLEMGALHEKTGIRQGAVMAASAGCDIILVCSSNTLQRDAFTGMCDAFASGILHADVLASIARISHMKDKYLNWQDAMHPAGIALLQRLRLEHSLLSREVYEKSTTLVRNHTKLIPLSNSIPPDASILLLTPLVIPLISSVRNAESSKGLFIGEDVFLKLGQEFSKFHPGKIFHTTYTANGISNVHEKLLKKSQIVVIVTTDVTRNMYQIGFTKHITHICSYERKPVIIVAASSPYDYSLDRGIGTYLCSYEFTPEALECLARVIFGQLLPTGRIPGTEHRPSKVVPGPTNRWLVDTYDAKIHLNSLLELWTRCFPESEVTADFFEVLSDPNQKHFIVQNYSTNELYGFAGTWVSNKGRLGSLLMILVDPARRNMSIGTSLHLSAMRYLITDQHVKRVKLGSSIPLFFGGLPFLQFAQQERESVLAKWFSDLGWDTTTNERSMMILKNLEEWSPMRHVVQELKMVGVMFDICLSEMDDQISGLIAQQPPLMQDQLNMLYDAARERVDSRVIVAVEKDTKEIVGSIVLFTKHSSVAKFHPWINEFRSRFVAGLSSPIVNGSYQNLAGIFTLGLVYSALRHLKMQNFTSCILGRVDSTLENTFIGAGFTTWRRFTEIEMSAARWMTPDM